jgi:hypothetical protein
MNTKLLADSETANKLVNGASGPPLGPLQCFTMLASSGAVLTMTARFGRSPAREAAYRLHARRSSGELSATGSTGIRSSSFARTDGRPK